MCAAAYYNAYNESRKEEHDAYRETHRTEKAVYDAAYREVNRVDLTIKKSAYYEEHKEERAVYYEEHAAEQAVYHAAWNRANPERVSAYGARRRAKVMVNMDRLDRDLSVEYRKAIAHDLCFYCKIRPGVEDEHYVPLANGGTDHWWNLVRACASCNLRKHTMNGDEFILSLETIGVGL